MGFRNRSHTAQPVRTHGAIRATRANRATPAVAFVEPLEGRRMLSAAPTETEVTGFFVAASFQWVDPTGYIHTEVTIDGGDLLREDGTLAPTAGAAISVYNLDTFETTIHALGVSSERTLSVAPDLSSARLVTTVSIVDQANLNNKFNVYIDLTFVATPAKATTSHDTSVFKEDGTTTVTRFSSEVRTATASGSVSDGVTNYIASQSSTGATIARYTYSTLVISPPTQSTSTASDTSTTAAKSIASDLFSQTPVLN